MKFHLQLAGLSLSGLFLLVNPSAFADEHEHHHEHREHGAHVHGAATLNMAIDGSSLLIELESPAMNIVGFEHQPGNHEQHLAVEQAAAQLKDGDSLFVLPAAAQCTLVEVEVDSPLLEAEHAHEKHHADDGDEHSEFTASYVFHCQKIEVLRQVDVKLFDKFKATHEIRVQLISDKGQTMKELTPGQHTLEL